MKVKSEKKAKSTSMPEQVSADEALRRMSKFAERKETFIAFIKKSTNRNLSAGKQGRP